MRAKGKGKKTKTYVKKNVNKM